MTSRAFRYAASAAVLILCSSVCTIALAHSRGGRDGNGGVPLINPPPDCRTETRKPEEDNTELRPDLDCDGGDGTSGVDGGSPFRIVPVAGNADLGISGDSGEGDGGGHGAPAPIGSTVVALLGAVVIVAAAHVRRSRSR